MIPKRNLNPKKNNCLKNVYWLLICHWGDKKWFVWNGSLRNKSLRVEVRHDVIVNVGNLSHWTTHSSSCFSFSILSVTAANKMSFLNTIISGIILMSACQMLWLGEWIKCPCNNVVIMSHDIKCRGNRSELSRRRREGGLLDSVSYLLVAAMCVEELEFFHDYMEHKLLTHGKAQTESEAALKWWMLQVFLFY